MKLLYLCMYSNSQKPSDENNCCRKPHKTHKIVSYVNLTSNQVVYADGDFDPASNITVAPLTDVNPPQRSHLTPTKSCSEQFRLPEGLNVSPFVPLPFGMELTIGSDVN